MAIYEYVCEECKYQFEALRSMNDADQSILCEKCDSKNTHRLISKFFAQTRGHTITNTGGCGSCSGGSCSACNN